MKNLFFLSLFFVFAFTLNAQTTISSPGWYDVATTTAATADGKIVLTDVGASDNLSIYISSTRTSAVNQSRRMIYLQGVDEYSQSVFEKIRYTTNGIGAPLTVQIYVNAAATVDVAIEAGNLTNTMTEVNFTASTIPAGYDFPLAIKTESLEFTNSFTAFTVPGNSGGGAGDPTDELQILSVGGDTIYLSKNGGFVDLSPYIIENLVANTVPYADATGNLKGDIKSLEYDESVGSFCVNCDKTTPAGAWYGGYGFSNRWDGGIAANQPNWQSWMNFSNGNLEISDEDVNTCNPGLKFSARKNNGTQGGRSDFVVGDKVGALKSTAWVGSDAYANTGGKQNAQNRVDILVARVSDISGSIATGNHKVATETAFQARKLTDPWNGGHDVLVVNGQDDSVKIPGYINVSVLGTDAEGKLIPAIIAPESLDWSNVPSYSDNAAALAALGSGKVWQGDGTGSPARGVVAITYNPGVTQ